MTPRASRGALAAWAAFLLTLLAGLMWGAHQPFSWDADNIAPGSVLKGLQAHFGPRWYSSYGPLPYQLVGLVYLPALALMRAAGELGRPVANYPWGFAHPDVSIPALIALARLVSVALAAFAVAALGRGSSESHAGRRWLAPLLALGSPVLVYYARTSNVDIFYFAWIAIAFHLAERPDARLGTLALAAAAAMCAVCSKEPAAPLALVATLAAALRAWRAPGGGARAAGIVLAAAAGTYALLWKLPFGLEAWRGHHEFILHVARYPRTYPLTLDGLARMGLRLWDLLPVALGWPVIVGVLLVPFSRPSLAGLGPRAIAVALYVAGFLGPVGYIYPRFLLPLLLLALPLALRGLDAVLDSFRAGVVRRVAVAALLAACLSGGPNLTRVQFQDTRFEVGAWLARLPQGTRVEVAGNPRFQAHVPPRLPVVYTTVDSLARLPHGPLGDVVLLSMFDDRWFREDSLARDAWWRPLSEGGGYRSLVWRPRSSLGNVRDLFVSPIIFGWVRLGSEADRATSR